MSRQNSMSYPGQGRVKDPQLPKDPDGGRQGQGKAAQSEPNRDGSRSSTKARSPLSATKHRPKADTGTRK
jgi:hypothetical protein